MYGISEYNGYNNGYDLPTVIATTAATSVVVTAGAIWTALRQINRLTPPQMGPAAGAPAGGVTVANDALGIGVRATVQQLNTLVDRISRSVAVSEDNRNMIAQIARNLPNTPPKTLSAWLLYQLRPSTHLNALTEAKSVVGGVASLIGNVFVTYFVVPFGLLQFAKSSFHLDQSPTYAAVTEALCNTPVMNKFIKPWCYTGEVVGHTVSTAAQATLKGGLQLMKIGGDAVRVVAEEEAFNVFKSAKESAREVLPGPLQRFFFTDKVVTDQTQEASMINLDDWADSESKDINNFGSFERADEAKAHQETEELNMLGVAGLTGGLAMLYFTFLMVKSSFQELMPAKVVKKPDVDENNNS